MALINIQTNLKSLKYTDFGVDAPLVTKSINNPPNQSGLSMEIGRRTDDLKRIGKLLTTGPGLTHLGNQAALNVLEQDIKKFRYRRVDGKTKQEFGDASFGADLLRGLGGTVTSLASTLAQIPVNGTGTHFVEGFAGKRGYLPQIQGHVLSRNGGIANIDTSLPFLQDEEGNATRFDGIGSRTGFESDLKKFTDVKKSIFEDPDDLDRQSQMISSYSGSSYNNEPLAYWNSVNARLDRNNFNSIELGLNQEPTLEDPFVAYDIINATLPKTVSLPEVEDLEGIPVQEQYKDVLRGDLIKFNFKKITSSGGEDNNPLVTSLTFRAFLDNFNDSYNASWNAFKYIGRAEDFYSYEGFDRGIQVSFKIAALSAPELRPLAQKLNELVSTTAPSYKGGGFMKGTLTSLTVGDYLIDQMGFIENIDLTWNAEYPWATSFNNEFLGSGELEVDADFQMIAEFPMVLEVSLSFTPIHQKIPTADSPNFIANKNQLYIPSPSADEGEQ